MPLPSKKILVMSTVLENCGEILLASRLFYFPAFMKWSFLVLPLISLHYFIVGKNWHPINSAPSNSKTGVTLTVTMHFYVLRTFIFDATLPIDLVRKRTLTVDEGFLWINWQKLHLCHHFSCLFWRFSWCVLWKNLGLSNFKESF